MNLKTVTSSLSNMLNLVRKPVSVVSAYMVYATAVMRPGMSRIKISSEVISDNEALGISTGDMPDGTENLVNQFVVNLVDKIVDSLQDEALVECVIPPGAVVVQANGGNAGGPVEAVGTNINNAKGYGIIR